MDNINFILEKFDFKGDLISCEIFGFGHINTTYIASYNDNGVVSKYIVQKVNTNVFKNIEALMDNIFSVTSFLRNKIENAGGNPDRETLNYIKTTNGDKFFRYNENECYRVYKFIDNSKSYNSVDSAEIFGKSGVVFGRFQKYLSDFPASTLNETIPDFHNTIWRFENEFLPSVSKDLCSRAGECQSEIDFVLQRKKDCSRLINLIDNGELPIRVTHNDTKLNNVIFDEKTDDAICVIDLDTVMPGLALYDFGDSIRFGANTADEDEKDTSKVSVNLDYFKAYAKGFLSEAGDSLNSCELDNLAFASKLMTLECGMRFLTDYLNGDTYFKTAYPQHNLVRAKNQFALVADMENKMEQMEQIIRDLTR